MGAAITKKALEDQINVFVLHVFHSYLSPMLSVVYAHKAELTELFFAESNIFLFGMSPKLYIPSTLNIDPILWHTQLIVCAVKY